MSDFSICTFCRYDPKAKRWVDVYEVWANGDVVFRGTSDECQNFIDRQLAKNPKQLTTA